MSELVSIFPENGKSHDGYMHRLDLVSFQEHGSLLGMGKRRYKKVFFISYPLHHDYLTLILTHLQQELSRSHVLFV